MTNTYKINNSVTLPTGPNIGSLSYTTGSVLGSNVTLTTTAGANGTSWIGSGIYTTTPNYNIGDGVMKISGDPASLEVKGKVVINGLDLEERLKTIEQVLMIPERDATMEAKYPSLKKKYDEYIKELSKYRMWDTIKGDNK